jgi:hypothetical protein
MAPLVPPNRPICKAGVNACRSLFERCGYIFQEVELGNDFGKDAYVDLVDGREVTGACIALQIKSGESFRRRDGYSIPIGEHYSVWRQSSIPVAGIVYDPAEGRLYWCNISEHLESNAGEAPNAIPIGNDQFLDETTLETRFKREMVRWIDRKSVASGLLQLCSESEKLQISAIYDCLGVGRSEPRFLILLRHLMGLLSGDPLRCAVSVLARATPHPDIMWTRHNWIDDHVQSRVRPHLNWTVDEICRLFLLFDWSEWERGSAGQDLYMILRQDPEIERKMEAVAIRLLIEGHDEHAFGALYLVVYWAAETGPEKYRELVSRHPEFRSLSLSGDLESILSEVGYVGLF